MNCAEKRFVQKNSFFIVFLLAAVIFSAKNATAQSNVIDVSGVWIVESTSNSGVKSELRLTINQNGKALDGTWEYVKDPDQVIEFEGSIEGNYITIVGKTKENGRDIIISREGEVNGDEIDGTWTIALGSGRKLDMIMKWSGKRISGQASKVAINKDEKVYVVASTPQEGLLENFQEALDQVHTDARFPGAIAAFILNDGRSGLVATGLADQELGLAMKQTDLLHAGSIGKTFVSAVILDLVQKGEFELNTPISKWFKDESWFKRLPNWEDITIRMLMNHSSGIIDHVNSDQYLSDVQELVKNIEENEDYVFPPSKLVEYVLDKEPLFKAGEGYSYTDTGYILLGLIIEKVTGEDYYDVLRDRFLSPHTLTSTIPANRRALDGLVPGYVVKEHPLGLPQKIVENGVMMFNPLSEWTGGGLISNPSDLVKWAKILYEGNALSGDYLKDLLAPNNADSQEGRYYGLGVSISTTKYGKGYGHDGTFPGYRSKVIYYPAYKMAVAIQVNTDVNVDLGNYISRLSEVLLITDSK